MALIQKLQNAPPGFRERALPRLDASAYRSDATVLWTFTTEKRATGWLNTNFHLQFRELLLHACVRQAALCPIYTLMPDHLHLALIGTQLRSDQRAAIAFLRTHLEPLIAPVRFQHQPHDHVLSVQERTQNAFTKTCRYIALNSERAGLSDHAQNWPFTGCLIPGYARVSPFDDEYWTWFWKIFRKQRAPECDSHIATRAPFSSSNTKAEPPAE